MRQRQIFPGGGAERALRAGVGAAIVGVFGEEAADALEDGEGGEGSEGEFGRSYNRSQPEVVRVSGET